MKGTDRASSRGGSVESRQTLLLPHLFETLEEGARLTVLDVGPGVPETVEFFSRYRCRLHFADLFDHPALAQPPEEDVELHYQSVFAELCDFPETTRFDVCLLWDFLNHLPLPGVRAFSRVLRPYLHRDSSGHGFGAFKASAPAASRSAPQEALRYGIRDVDQLVVRPLPGASPPGFAHSRTALAEALTCFEIVRGTLLREGAMELLLRAR